MKENSNPRLTESALKIESLKAEAHSLEGRRTALLEQKASSIIDIETAQDYLKHKDEVLSFLNSLQQTAQQKTKTMYEDLLTSLIREVLPHKTDYITFDTSIKNSKMALEVNIVNQNGQKLNVVKDKGGTIQNIVSMGLRFITVARSRNRKIILFDEADQWLKTKYIPRFAKIIRKLSEELGVQVLYISHHSPEAFANHAKVITIAEKNGLVYCHDDAEPNIGSDDIGIRHVRLKNFKNHTDTLIHLDKYVTVITGEGDVGKSSIIEAFDIVMNNDARDAVVRDQVECSIELGIEEGRTISFSYNLKRDKKTLYKLIESDSHVASRSADGNSKPDWLDDYLATPLVAGFDIHISPQFQSNFILHPMYSAQKRAEILALDNEAEHIQKIIKLHSEKSSMYQKSLTSLNKTLNEVKNKLDSFRILTDAFDRIEIAERFIEDANEHDTKIKSLIECGKKLASVDLKVQAYSAINELQPVSSDISFEKTEVLENATQELEEKYNLVRIYEACENIAPIDCHELEPIMPIKIAGATLKKAIERVEVLSLISDLKEIDCQELIAVPNEIEITNLENLTIRVQAFSLVSNINAIPETRIESSANVNQLITQLEQARQSIDSLASSVSLSEQRLASVNQEVEKMEADMGHCPLCKSDLCKPQHKVA